MSTVNAENLYLLARVFKVLAGVLGIIAVGAFCAPIYLAIKERRLRKRRLRELYASRESLTADEFYARFYESRNVPKEIVLKATEILGEELSPLDMSRIVPQDDFTGNLSILWGHWSGLHGLEVVYAVERFETEFGIAVEDYEAKSLKTIDDMIMMIWWKTLHDGTKVSNVA
jgi:hypothetical protein